MSETTTIAWTESTWNPLRAQRYDREAEPRPGWSCVRVSPGCTHCYAETINKRLGTGLGYTEPNRRAVEHFINERQLTEPLHWRKPRRVFVCSMTDLFGEWVTDEQLDRVFRMIQRCPQHIFQVLTKRPERMHDYVCTRWGANWSEHNYMRNVWLGVSAEDQQRADERIPILLDTPAAVRWVSAEPLLGPINLIDHLLPRGHVHMADDASQESGPGARPFDLAWARSIRDQCREAGVAFFMKQVGARPETATFERATPQLPYRSAYPDYDGKWPIRFSDRKGEDPAEWPEDLRVREYPR